MKTDSLPELKSYFTIFYSFKSLFLQYFYCMSLVVLFFCTFKNLCVVAFIEIFSYFKKIDTKNVLIMKIWLECDLFKPHFKHIKNNFLSDEFIHVPLSLNNEAFKIGFFILRFPKPFDMSRWKKFQYNVRLFTIRYTIDDNFLWREIKIEILFSSEKTGFLKSGFK